MDKINKPLLVANNEQEKLKSEHPELGIIDQLVQNLGELFLLRNPWTKFNPNYQSELGEFLKKYDQEDFGNWFYFSTALRYFCIFAKSYCLNKLFFVLRFFYSVLKLRVFHKI